MKKALLARLAERGVSSSSAAGGASSSSAGLARPNAVSSFRSRLQASLDPAFQEPRAPEPAAAASDAVAPFFEEEEHYHSDDSMGGSTDYDGLEEDEDDDGHFFGLGDLPARPFAAYHRNHPPCKRARTEKTALFPLPEGTALQGNSGDPAAANPPLFEAHPLREEQCRSLAWMISREKAKDGLRGGLLADKMGYGKTSTSIGLLSLSQQRPQETCPAGYVPAKGTLIICPPRLVQQWEEEFVKFLGDALAVWHLGENGECPEKVRGSGSAQIKLLVLASRKTMKTSDRYVSKLPRGVPLDDFSKKFDVVLASSSIQANSDYYKKSIDLACKLGAGAMKGQLMAKRMEALRSVLTKKKSEVVEMFNESKKEQFPAFEMFWWHRLILDEFHESESWEYRVREMMKSVGATHRWGLSGTPPLGSCEAVSQVAELLWFPKYEEAPRIAKLVQTSKPNAPKCQLEKFKSLKNVEKDLHEEVRRFLSSCVRQNASEVVEAIRMEEHLELIHHIAEERLIYRQACHDEGIFDLAQDYAGVSIEAREALLLRCAHFSLDGDADASSAVQHLGKSKQERIKDAEQQLRLELQRASILGLAAEARAELAALRDLHQDAAKSIAKIAAVSTEDLVASCKKEGLLFEIERYTIEGELRAHPEVKFQQPLRDNECYKNPQHRHAIMHELARHGDKSAAKILGGLQLCHQACRGPRGKAAKAALLTAVPHVAHLVDAAHRSLQFYEAQLRGLSQSQGGLQEECAICLEPMSDAKAVALLPCSHMFHTECVRQVLQQQRKCPHCNAKVEVHQLTSAVMEMQAPEEVVVSPPEALSPALRAHGSKLNAVAERLRQIRMADEKAQAIVFVQWLSLESQVASALKAHDLPFIRATGAATMGDSMRRFQQGEGPWVLILSLERAASGLNLTAANHVLFVHPMNAATVSTANDYEQQAIGRIRRVGQTRSEVHVWRFVTANTVEEHISKLHRAAASGQTSTP